MGILRRYAIQWVSGGLLGALAIAGLTAGNGPLTPAAQAQQDDWTTDAAGRQKIRLLETRNASGPPAYPVEPGDLLFFTNVGTSYGGTNPRNSVVVINARTKKPIAVSDIEPQWSERFGSHGIGVSPDGKFVYLPAQPPARRGEKRPPGVTLILDARTLKIYQIITSGAERVHHVKIYEDGTGKARVLVEDFNWTNQVPNGQGFYILDPTDNNKVVAGMTPGDLRGIRMPALPPLTADISIFRCRPATARSEV